MKRIKIIIVLIYSAFIAQAQTNLTLPDAVNMALKKSLDVQLANNQVQITHINNDYGVAGGLPLVTGNISDNEQISSVNQQLSTGSDINRAGASSNSLSAGVTGSILLYNGGRVIATKKRLAELEGQSKLLLTEQVQNILGSTMTGYYDVVRQQSYLRTIDKSIINARQKLDIVKTRQNLGLANNADLFQAEIDLNELLAEEQAQMLVIAQTKAELARLMTSKPDTSFTIEDTIIVDRNINLQNILASLDKNAGIMAANDQVRINQLIVKETDAQRYPSIRANAGYNFARSQTAAGQVLLNQNYGPFIGFTVGIPIYNGGIYKKQKQVAQINVDNARLQEDILVRDYGAEIVKMFESYASALSQFDTEQKNYALSAQLLDLVLQRFQLRQATIIDVRTAQQSFEASGYRLVNLSFAAKLAEIDMKKLANQLNP